MKKLVYLLAFLLVLGFVSIASLPCIVSKSWGKEFFCSTISYLTKAHLQIEDLSLGWFQGQHIKNLSYAKKDGSIRFTLQSLDTPSSLWEIIGKNKVKEAVIQMPSLHLSNPVKNRVGLPLPDQASFLPHVATEREGEEFSFAYHPVIFPYQGWKEIEGSLHIVKGELFFTKEQEEEISLEQLDLFVERKEQKEWKIKAFGNTKQAQIVGNFQLNGAFTKEQAEKIEGDLEGKIIDFPTPLIGEITKLFSLTTSSSLITSIGPSFSATLHMSNRQENIALSLDATSRQFSAYVETKLSLEETKELILSGPALVSWHLQPEVIQELCGFTPQEMVHATFKIEDLSIPLENFGKTKAKGEFRSSAFVVKEKQIEPILFQVEIPEWDKKIYRCSLVHPWVGWKEAEVGLQEDKIALLQPLVLQGKVEGTVSHFQCLLSAIESLELAMELRLPFFMEKEKIPFLISCQGLQNIHIQSDSPSLKTSLLGSVDMEEKNFKLKEPGFIECMLKSEEPQSWISQPFPLHIALQKLFIPWQDLGDISLDVSGQVDHGIIGETPFSDLIFSLHMQGKEKKGAFSGRVLFAGGELQLRLDTHKWFPNLELYTAFKGEALPTSLIEKVASLSFPLEPLLGPTLFLQGDTHQSLDVHSLRLKIVGENVHCDLDGEVKKGAFHLAKPLKIEGSLSPEGYAVLQKSFPSLFPPYQLKTILPLQLQMEKCTFPVTVTAIKGQLADLVFFIPQFKVDYDLSKTAIHGDFVSKPFTFEGLGGNSCKINHCKVHFNQPEIGETLSFACTASMGENGILSSQGSIRKQDQEYRMDTRLQHVPSAFLDLVSFKALHPLYAEDLLGAEITGRIQMQLVKGTGPIHMVLEGPVLRSNIDAQVKENILLLNNQASFSFQPAFGEKSRWVDDISPLLSTGIQCKETLSMAIPAEGVKIPIGDSLWKAAVIPHFTINFGKIETARKGNLALILSLLQKDLHPKGLKIWCGPIRGGLNQGLITLERTDFLIEEKYQLCSWGTWNVVSEQFEGILGITASALEKAFKIHTLPPNYVLQIPLKGTVDNVKVDAKTAGAKIAALLLWNSQVGKEGSSSGNLFKELLKQAGPLPDQTAQAPDAFSPLPWETKKAE